MRPLLLKVLAGVAATGIGFQVGARHAFPAGESSGTDLPAASAAPRPEPATVYKPSSLVQYLGLFDPARPTCGLHAGMTALRSLDAGLRAEWWDQLMADESLRNQSAGIACLASRWVEADPASARRWLRENPASAGSGVLMERLISQAVMDNASADEASIPPADSRLHDAWMRGIAAALTPRDPIAAWSWAKGLKDAGLQKEASLKVLRRLAPLDPARAAACCQEAGIKDQGLLESIMAHWIRIDPPAAWDWMQTLDTEIQDGLTNQSLAALAESNPADAIARLEQMPRTDRLRNTIDSLAKSMARRNPEAAAALLLPHARRDGAFGTHNWILGQILGQWMAEDGPSALAWLNRSGDVGFGAAVEGSRAILKQFGPEAALDFYFHAKELKIEASLDSNLFTAWADNDPEGLLTVLKNDSRLAPNSARIADDLASAMARTDPRRAIGALMELSKNGIPWTQINNLARRVDNGDPAIMAQALSGLIAGQGGEANPPAASPPGGDPFAAAPKGLRADALAAVAKRYAQQAPSDAARWTESLPDGAGRDSARTAVAAVWADLDPVGASEWLVTLPFSPARDAAVAELVKKIAPFDPERAAQWNASIQEEQLRRK